MSPAPLCSYCDQRPAPKWRYLLPNRTTVPLCDQCAGDILGAVERPALFDQDAAPGPADLARHPSAGN